MFEPLGISRGLEEFRARSYFSRPTHRYRKGGPVNSISKLQFQRLPPEAKRAALWRLAWTGLPVEQIAERTGWSVAQVRRTIDEESLAQSVSWQPAKWASARQSLGA
jgi:hypothetical protein